MPTYVITAPDGKELEITAPEGATQEQVLAYAQSNYQTTPQEAPTAMESLKRGAGLAGRALVTGASAPANMVADFLSGAYNLGSQALGSESRLPYLSQEQQKGMTQLGVPTPSTVAEKAAMGGIEALSGAGAQQALVSGISGVAPTVAKALAPMAVSTPASFAATAVGGATAPASYEAVKEVTGNPLAASLASLGFSTVAAGLAGKAVSGATADKMPVVTMDDVKLRAQRAYKSIEDSGVAIKPQSTLGMVSDIKKALDNAGYNSKDTAQQSIGALADKFEEMVGTQRVPFTKLEQMRSMAVEQKNSKDSNIRRLAGIVVSKIDDYAASLTGKDIIAGQGKLDEAVKNVMSARQDWRNLSRANLLEDALNVANVKADNPKVSEAEAIRQGFINIAKDKNKMRQFAPEEQAAIRRVSSGIPLDTALSMAASFNPERSKLMLGSSLYGVGSQNTPLMAAGAAGFAADKLQQYLRKRQAQGLISDILSQNVQPMRPTELTKGLFSLQAQTP